ncbi:MAG: hypothetical protein KGV56_04640 [Gammaproteobacteria bacterium]|nr:hypothetical protein [Gammaproteobacteria bacterium]
MANFTQTEINKIKAIFADIKNRTEGDNLTAKDPNDKPFADGYAMMAELLANRLATDTLLSNGERQELQYVQNWFSGAEKVNRGEGSFSTMIRTYSDVQSQLRYNESVTDAKMQEASNKIGLNAFEAFEKQFFPQEGSPDYTMPNMDFIAEKDAVGAAQVLFDRDTTDSAYHKNQNSAWSGVPLFSVLGSDQTGRVLGDDNQFNTLNDLRDTMFMVESFRQAFTETFANATNTIKIITALSLNYTTRPLAEKYAKELLEEMGLFVSPKLIANFASELLSYQSEDYEKNDAVQVLADSFLLAMINDEVAYDTVKQLIKSGNYQLLETLQKFY